MESGNGGYVGCLRFVGDTAMKIGNEQFTVRKRIVRRSRVRVDVGVLFPRAGGERRQRFSERPSGRTIA